MEQVFRAQLKADDGLAALVGTRIDWGELQQGTALPAVMLRKVGSPRTHTLTGRDRLVGHRVRAYCYGDTYKAAYDCSRAVIAAIDALPRTPAEATDLIDDMGEPVETEGRPLRYRYLLDLRVWRTDAAG